MEGRAIARPNAHHPHRRRPCTRRTSMEGRANARPNQGAGGRCGGQDRPSMEGRANARPNPRTAYCTSTHCDRLQWRAGQLPGRTSSEHFNVELKADASMEGRAIARPNAAHRCGHRVRGRAASMEGRAIARPNSHMMPAATPIVRPLQWRAGQLPGRTRGMAAVARPTSWGFNGGPGNCPAEPRRSPPLATRRRRFNGGPGNCPAEPTWGGSTVTNTTLLQWRAGQLPGRTPPASGPHRSPLCRFNGGPGNCPAEPAASRPHSGARPRFNGGPGNCPAEPAASRPHSGARPRFNGGPGNCPAEHQRQHGERQPRIVASMEGRAIARPNRCRPTTGRPPSSSLQWRAGQLPGRTRTSASVPSSTTTRLQWRAGQLPGRTAQPRRRSHHREDELQWRAGQLPGRTPQPSAALRRAHGASMEGRAIARPNPYGGDRRGGLRGRFNGGPGNCPAELPTLDLPGGVQSRLQWRAGQLPGRTRSWSEVFGLWVLASMEGRAIARPNFPVLRVTRSV